MLNIKIIEDVFQYFYCKKYGFKKIPAKTEKTRNVCENFLTLLDKRFGLPGLGKTFIWEYFLFQFNYWDELTVSAYSETISINFIVGKKAFKRYLDRDKEFDWQMDTYPIVAKYKLLKSDLNIFFAVTEVKKPDVSVQMQIRKQFYNTEKGFANCVEFTTLYEPAQVCCITCKFKQECKELKRVNY